MTHVRPETKSPRRSRSDCRKGLHQFGETQNVGAGIGRRVCAICNAVTIDLTATHEPVEPVIGSRRRSRS
ncbi:MAG: hypothetical protein L0Z49_07115 [Actinobacteria bacterium]|nr:hypothetical protein [Actinomycetota bacterium]MCI0544203.1 hypothetical protein [Actinomycetota bacterium]MCI0678956.1 hypothetical protein [Actinomycetota bacterium]